MKHIFESANLGNLTLQNRLIRSATWEGIAARDGGITENAYAIYDELSKGGVGAIITGFTSVAENDHYFGGMMRLCSDALIPQYKRLADVIHANGSPVITQLAVGTFYRDESGYSELVEPDEMTVEEIRLVVRQFIDAAIRAKDAGFDGAQIHAAHFFFLSRFISPAVNHRMDAYGGSTENRSRILTEIMEGIRKEVPGLHITIKINSNDFTRGGLDEAEQITHTGALLVGTYDNFTDGDPVEFLKNLNHHMPTAGQNTLIFIERTGHTYQMKHQEVADDILKQLQKWRNEACRS